MSEQGNSEEQQAGKNENSSEKIKSQEALQALVEKIRTAQSVNIRVDIEKEKKTGGKDDDGKKKEGGAESEKGGDGKEDEKKDKKSKEPPLYKRPEFILAAAVVFLVIVVAGLLYWLHARQYVSTDDAYIDGHVTQMSPQVPGRIAILHVSDNQLVHRGDLLVELDPTDYEVALEQARAQELDAKGRLIQAQTEIASAQANVSQATAQVDAAQVARDNATQDLKRYQDVDPRARSQQQLDNATANQRSAEANLVRAGAQKTSSEANVTSAEAAVKTAEGGFAVARAGVRRAEVNLAYCRITAPTDGRVTDRTAETGNYLQPGQVMFSLVVPDVWITANFKETQLKHMQPGQQVTIKIDAFPNLKLSGHVDSIQSGSGARFSVLPAENATGNFVKIVQRVPVKILFDNGSNTNDVRLWTPGLSVVPKVKVR